MQASWPGHWAGGRRRAGFGSGSRAVELSESAGLRAVGIAVSLLVAGQAEIGAPFDSGRHDDNGDVDAKKCRVFKSQGLLIDKRCWCGVESSQVETR